QTGAAVARGGIRDDGRVLGVLGRDRVEGGVEGGGGVLDELAHATDRVQGAVRGVLDGGDQPCLVSDGDQGAWGDHSGVLGDQLRVQSTPHPCRSRLVTLRQLPSSVQVREEIGTVRLVNGEKRCPAAAHGGQLLAVCRFHNLPVPLPPV